MLSSLRLVRLLQPPTRALVARRQLHLQQAVALRLLESEGFPVAPFELLSSANDASQALKVLGSEQVEVRAQLTDAAGVSALRDGKFGSLQGISFTAQSEEQLRSLTSTILSTSFELPNAPTGLQHRDCSSVLVKGTLDAKSTARVLFYCRRTRTSGGPALVGARAISLDNFDSLRVFADQNPSEATSLPISIAHGLSLSQATTFVKNLGVKASKSPAEKAAAVLVQLYQDVFVGKDALRVEVWLSAGPDGEVTISDARIELDDFAAYRQDRTGLAEGTLIHPAEAEAAKSGLFLIKPSVTPTQPRGNIGCFGYGAGLAMSTMDAVVAAGGAPANFLDGGGGATAANAKVSIQVLANDPDIKVIFVNIFGGITQTDKVAAGIISAYNETPRLANKSVPVVIRIRGTGETEAKKLLNNSGIPFILEDDFSVAAQKAVEAAR